MDQLHVLRYAYVSNVANLQFHKTSRQRKESLFFVLPDYVYLLFIMLLGFYILMRAFDASPLISALGAILWTFSSYFLIIIAAGHIWKFITLAYIPPTIAGLVYAYRKNIFSSIARHGICRFSNLRQSHSNELLFLFVMFFMVLAFLSMP